jgi:hypothetical protein
VNASVFDNLNILIDNFVEYCSHADKVDKERKMKKERETILTFTTNKGPLERDFKDTSTFKRKSQKVVKVPKTKNRKKKDFSKSTRNY